MVLHVYHLHIRILSRLNIPYSLKSRFYLQILYLINITDTERICITNKLLLNGQMSES